jgi:hypothetical protein
MGEAQGLSEAGKLLWLSCTGFYGGHPTAGLLNPAGSQAASTNLYPFGSTIDQGPHALEIGVKPPSG